MKTKAIFISVIFTFIGVSLYAYNDEYRLGSILKTKKAWNLPAKQPGGLILNEISYYKEGDFAILSFVGGMPDKDAVKVGGMAFWASEAGKKLQREGFKDWIYNYGDYNRATKTIVEHGLFSCAEGKWYRNGEEFFRAKGLN